MPSAPAPAGDGFERGSHTAQAVENPPWNLWDVVLLGLATFLTVVLSLLAVSFVAHRYIYRSVPWMEVAKRPELIVASQLLAYGIVLGVMYQLAGGTSRGQAAETIRWNWPRHWTYFLFCGLALSIGLQLFAHLLPMPKKLPIDEFFQTPREAWLLSIFGITFAPLLEELYFRGFLYPVLARRFGVFAGIILTALGFAAIHASQLMYSWGPVLVIFLVGLALTGVRAHSKSVASTLLMHIGYNATISVALFMATDGFRHLERLNQ
jgi:membrane protease YdiL (CAAX protease family)